MRKIFNFILQKSFFCLTVICFVKKELSTLDLNYQYQIYGIDQLKQLVRDFYRDCHLVVREKFLEFSCDSFFKYEIYCL